MNIARGSGDNASNNTEDSGSGEQLWRSINKHILKGKAKVLSTYKGQSNTLGFGTMNPRLIEAINNGTIKSGDTVLFAIDNTGSMSVIQQLRNTRRECVKHNIGLIVTTYYCIEEVLLSFEYLEEWLASVDEQYIDTLKLVQESILNKRDYFELNAKEITRFRENVPGTSNREKFAYQLLRLITAKSGNFRYTKNRLGKCWVNDCCTVRDAIPQYDTSKCGLDKHHISAETKMKLIENKSVLGVGEIGIEKLIEVAYK